MRYLELIKAIVNNYHAVPETARITNEDLINLWLSKDFIDYSEKNISSIT